MGHIKPRAPVPPTGGPHGPRGKRNPDDTQEQLDEISNSISEFLELKIWPDYFDAVKDRRKNFVFREVRDRDFNVGDVLILREYDPRTLDYTGRVCRRPITYCLWLDEYGLRVSKYRATHVIMSI